jgi:hypothetical protein
MTTTEESVQKLTETVNTLAAALAKSEARYRSMERLFRWGGLSILAFAGFASYFAFGLVAKAQTPGGGPDMALTKMLEQLVQLGAALQDPKNQSLRTQFSESVQNVGFVLGSVLSNIVLSPERSPPWRERRGPGALPTAERAVSRTPGTAASPSPQTARPNPSRQAKPEQPSPTLSGAPSVLPMPASCIPNCITAGEVAQDVAMLLANFKEDSDWLRLHTDPSDDVRGQLARMNVALSAVPVMASEMNQMKVAMTGEMHQMNLSMLSMTRSVGSTMGRFGSMMPW